MNHKYSLDKSSKKHICPQCKKKRFVLYLDNETRQPVHSSVGKCDRQDNCRYHYTPKQYFADNSILTTASCPYTRQPQKSSNPAHNPDCPQSIENRKSKIENQNSTIDKNIMTQTLKNYHQNTFIQWLTQIVGTYHTQQAIERYFIGTSKEGEGSPVFWQIDINANIRSGKIMQYHRKTGKRRKDIHPSEAIKWAHKILNIPNFNLQQCFFGEHLLAIDDSQPKTENLKSKTIAIVESEKTAIIASIYIPSLIWLSCGSANGMGGENSINEKCNVLKDRNVILYPDCGTYALWCKKAQQLSKICKSANVSNLIEKHATPQEKQSGYDIADYLIKHSPALTSMISKNPALKKLIKTFDCIEIRSE